MHRQTRPSFPDPADVLNNVFFTFTHFEGDDLRNLQSARDRWPCRESRPLNSHKAGASEFSCILHGCWEQNEPTKQTSEDCASWPVSHLPSKSVGKLFELIRELLRYTNMSGSLEVLLAQKQTWKICSCCR